MRKLPATTARNQRNIRADRWIAKILRYFDPQSIPNAHFQSILSGRKAANYACDKLMMFCACCCATKHFLFIFMTP
jgi:hypothetical protein